MNKSVTYHFFSCIGCPSFGVNEYNVCLCWFNPDKLPIIFSSEETNMLYAADEWTPQPHWFPEWCPINDKTCNLFQE